MKENSHSIPLMSRRSTNSNGSKYNAGLTGCRFCLDEMNRVLPLMLSEDSEALLAAELKNNEYLLIRTESSRSRTMSELRRRFDAMSVDFWQYYQTLCEESQKAAMLFAVLKTYHIAMDFHLNVVIEKWKSVDQTVSPYDLEMEFNNIASKDEFVDSWSDATRKKIASSYLTILRQAGLLNERTDVLQPLRIADEDFAYYIKQGEGWFLEACLLQSYEIERIKSVLL